MLEVTFKIGCWAPDAPALAITALYKRSLAGLAVLQVDQAAPAHQAILRYQRERGEGANLVRRSHLRVDRHCQERASTHRLAVHMSTDLVSLDLRENRDFMRLAARSVPTRNSYSR